MKGKHKKKKKPTIFPGQRNFISKHCINDKCTMLKPKK